MTENRNNNFKYRRRVEFADTDMAGIVHFANFFRFMEEAEHAYYRFLGIPIHPPGAENTFGWPRVHVECDYKKPARFEDVLDIYVAVVNIREKTIQHAITICRRENSEIVEIAVGNIIAACVSYNEKEKWMKAIPIPTVIRDKFVSAS